MEHEFPLYPPQQQQPCSCPAGRFCRRPAMTLCWIHNAHEAGEDELVYLVCGECGHVFRTPADLEKNWLDEVGYVRNAELIFSCPFCVHDF